METWYEVSSWKESIKPVQVVRHTPSSVWVMEKTIWDSKYVERRHPRETTSITYHSTKEAAIAAIKVRLVAEVEGAERKLQRAQSELEHFGRAVEAGTVEKE